jgi:hypothetical protein
MLPQFTATMLGDNKRYGKNNHCLAIFAIKQNNLEMVKAISHVLDYNQVCSSYGDPAVLWAAYLGQNVGDFNTLSYAGDCKS